MRRKSGYPKRAICNTPSSVAESVTGLRLPRGERVVWEAGVSRRDRNSTLEELEYDGKLFTIGVTLQLTR